MKTDMSDYVHISRWIKDLIKIVALMDYIFIK